MRMLEIAVVVVAYCVVMVALVVGVVVVVVVEPQEFPVSLAAVVIHLVVEERSLLEVHLPLPLWSQRVQQVRSLKRGSATNVSGNVLKAFKRRSTLVTECGGVGGSKSGGISP